MVRMTISIDDHDDYDNHDHIYHHDYHDNINNHDVYDNIDDHEPTYMNTSQTTYSKQNNNTTYDIPRSASGATNIYDIPKSHYLEMKFTDVFIKWKRFRLVLKSLRQEKFEIGLENLL